MLNKLLGLFALVAFAITGAPRIAASATRDVEPPSAFRCSPPLAPPNFISAGDTSNPDLWKSDGTAMSYLFVGGKLQSDFSLSARLTNPAVPINRGYFYSNWLLLTSLPGGPFVQLELMRYRTTGYRNEVAISWALPDGKLRYRDTNVFVSDAPHELRIAVKAGTIRLSVDGRTICTTPQATYFAAKIRLYFQVGTEAIRFGDHTEGFVDQIRLKTDVDTSPQPYTVQCIYRGYGFSWEPAGPGRFEAAGVFDPSYRPAEFFSGISRSDRCIY